MIKYSLSILFFIFFINSCSFSSDTEKKIIKVKNSFFLKKKINTFRLNFDATVENIILEMLNCNNIFIFKNTLFFIDVLENNTNIFIDIEKLTNLIKKKISKKNNKIYFLKKKIIKKNKEQLGILQIKNILDTSTALLLSRNNHVKYYLHSCISNKNTYFFLKMELILVKTGEIVFMKKEKFSG